MSLITKEALRKSLKTGLKMRELFDFSDGQDCLIFKAEKFLPGDKIIYIPDVALNEIPLGRPVAVDDEITEILDKCYTGNDFIDLCDGDVKLAERLFRYCDWQHPTSALNEVTDDEEDV